MYESFYKLKEEPFRLSPDHRFSSRHPTYARAADYLRYGVERAEGIVMITGAPGTGKSTLVGDLIDGISPTRVLVANLVINQLEGDDLLRATAYAFGLRAEGLDKATVLHRIEDFFIQQAEAERRVLLVVDEAQGLPARALEELRLLTNLQLRGQPLLQVFLLGQEGLLEVVHDPSMEQLQQRIIAACHLEPLNEDETRTYVENRLEYAGWQGDPAIMDEAFSLIHQFSRGIPRRINLLCSRLLLYGSVDEKHELDGEDVQNVIEDLRREMLIRGEERAGAQTVAKGDVPTRKTVAQNPGLRSLPGGGAVKAAPAFPHVENQPKPQSQEIWRPFSPEDRKLKEPGPQEHDQNTAAPGNRPAEPAPLAAAPKTSENESPPGSQNVRAARQSPAPQESSQERQPPTESTGPRRPPPERSAAQPRTARPPVSNPDGNAESPEKRHTQHKPASNDQRPHRPRPEPPPRPESSSRPESTPQPESSPQPPPPARPRQDRQPNAGRTPPRVSENKPSPRRPAPTLFADARADRLGATQITDPDLDEESDTPSAYGHWLTGALITVLVLCVIYILNPDESRLFIGAIAGWFGALWEGLFGATSG